LFILSLHQVISFNAGFYSLHVGGDDIIYDDIVTVLNGLKKILTQEAGHGIYTEKQLNLAMIFGQDDFLKYSVIFITLQGVAKKDISKYMLNKLSDEYILPKTLFGCSTILFGQANKISTILIMCHRIDQFTKVYEKGLKTSKTVESVMGICLRTIPKSKTAYCFFGGYFDKDLTKGAQKLHDCASEAFDTVNLLNTDKDKLDKIIMYTIGDFNTRSKLSAPLPASEKIETFLDNHIKRVVAGKEPTMAEVTADQDTLDFFQTSFKSHNTAGKKYLLNFIGTESVRRQYYSYRYKKTTESGTITPKNFQVKIREAQEIGKVKEKHYTLGYIQRLACIEDDEMDICGQTKVRFAEIIPPKFKSTSLNLLAIADIPLVKDSVAGKKEDGKEGKDGKKRHKRSIKMIQSQKKTTAAMKK